MSEAGAESSGTRGGKIHKGLTVGEKEPASWRVSLRSDVARAQDS